MSKGYDTFCPIASSIIPINKIPETKSLEIRCFVNGKLRQHGHLSDMIFDIPSIIEYTSRIMTLEPNDIILTGTPEGVAPIKPGDTIKAELVGHQEISFSVINRSYL